MTSQAAVAASSSLRLNERTSVFYALAAFLIWGVLPVYLKALGSVPPLEVMAHRVVWTVALLSLIAVVARTPSEIVQAFTRWRHLRVFLLTTTLISINWLLFIWAVSERHIVQASLGYFINPLVNVGLGIIFLGERLSRGQMVAIAAGTIGVGVLVAGAGVFPWIALLLAFTFGFYALVRKKAGVDPLLGLLVETALLTPVAAGYLLWLGAHGQGAFLNGPLEQDILLILAGGVTALPLILFMAAARSLKLSTIGIMQYIAPSCQLLLGVLVYGEDFSQMHAIAFGFIWLGLAVFTLDAVRRN